MKYFKLYFDINEKEIDYHYYNNEDLLIFDNVITSHCSQDLRIILISGYILGCNYKGDTFILKYLIDLEQFKHNIEIM